MILRITTFRVINGDQKSIVDMVDVERKYASRWVRRFMRDPHAEYVAVTRGGVAPNWAQIDAAQRPIIR